MHTCPYCGQPYRAGMLFCEDCGQQLFSGDDDTLSHMTRRPVQMQPPQRLMGHIPRRDEYKSVQVYVQDARMPIIIQPCKRTLLGRSDRDSETCPDIDLTAYGAREKGVSRIHAALECRDDAPVIVDLDSTNGVTINGYPLSRGASHVLHDGDEIQFGHLMTHIYFE